MLTSAVALRNRMLLGLAFALAWIVVDGLWIPPAFGNTDIYYFKDAALNFAEGRGLVTRFTFGNPSFEYRDFGIYPPLYASLFGIWARLTGISVWSNQLFNTCIATAAGLIMFAAWRRLARAESRSLGTSGGTLLLCATALVTGFFLPPDDRPDGLGVVWGVGALLLSATPDSRPTAILGGTLCGLSLFTSPFAGIWTSLAIVVCILSTSVWSAPGLKSACNRLLLIGLGVGVVGLVAVVVLRGWLPGWFDAFFGVATGSKTNNETGGGYFIALLHGQVWTWFGAFPLTLPSFYLALAKLLAVQIALLAWILIDRLRNGTAATARRLTPLVLLGLMCLITSPYQSNYPPMTAALLLAAWSAFAPAMPGGSRCPATRFATAAFTAVVILGLPFVARDTVIRWTAGTSIQRAIAYIAAHRRELAAPDALVAVSPTTFMLWRQEGLHPVISIYSGLNDARNRAHVQYVALAYPGSSNALQPQWPPWLDDREYHLTDRPVLPQLVTVFGHRASRSSQTWESEILRRRVGSLASNGNP
jgi:hypothetical protein